MSLPQVSQPEDDLSELKASVTTNPTNKDAVSLLAQTLAERGQYQEAFRLYEQLIRLDPENGQTWVYLGHAYYLKGDCDNCFAAFQKALSCKKEGDCEAQLWYGIGRLSAKMKDYSNAIRVLKIVFEVDPEFKDRGEVYLALAETYKELGNLPEAVNNWKLSLHHLSKPKQAKVLCEIGVLSQLTNSTQEALASFRKAAEADPSALRPLLHLAWAQVTDKDAALTCLQKAFEIAKSSPAFEPSVRYVRGRFLEVHKKLTESWEDFRAAAESEEPLYVCSLAVTQFQQKMFSAAVDTLERTLKIGNFPIVHYNLGIGLERVNRMQDAIESYQRACNFEGIAFPQAQSRLTALRERRSDPGDMVHPPFDILDGQLRIRANPPFPAVISLNVASAGKAKAPIFKVIRVTHVPAKPHPPPTVKKRQKPEVPQAPVQPQMDMYPMMPFYCMPPQPAEMEKQQMPGFPGYFQGQMMYYPFVPYFVPPNVRPDPSLPVPPPAPAVTTLSEPSDIAASVDESSSEKAELQELISDCKESDSGESVDGLHIGGRREESPGEEDE